MTEERNLARASIAEADSSAPALASQDSQACEWPTVNLQELLETLPPEERELLILATAGC